MKVTAQNYFEMVESVGVHNLPAVLKQGHDLVVRATKNGTNWESYKQSAAIKKNIEDHFDAVAEFIEEQGETETDEGERKVKKAKAKIKTKTKTKTRSAVKKASKSKSAKVKKFVKPDVKAKLVKAIKEERKIAKSFVGLLNKEKPLNSLLSLLKKQQRLIETEVIRKTSPFVKEMEFIQKYLINRYNSASNDKVKLTINDDKTVTRLMIVAGGEAVYKSIGLMKRMVGMKGKKVENKQLDSVLNSMKKVSRDDPFGDRIKAMMKSLNTAKSKGGNVEFTKSELGCLDGVIECCCNHEKELGRIYNTKGKKVRRCKSRKYSDAGKGACSYNEGLQLGKIYDTKGKKLRKCSSRKYSDARAGACSYNKGLAGVMTAEQIVNQKFILLPFQGEWERLMGRPEEGFSMMIHGEPKNGKSSFLVQFAKYLTTLGKVAYISSEEHGSVTLQNLVKYYMNPLPNNIVFARSLQQLKDEGYDIAEFDFVFLDSINDLGLKVIDFKMLKEQNPKISFIITLQHNKAGDFRGGKEWEHLVQIVAEVANWEMQVVRNRYGVKGSMNFYDPEFESKINNQPRTLTN